MNQATPDRFHQIGAMRLLWLVTVGVIIASPQADAQSDETCIAYMEADAAYAVVTQEMKNAEEAWLRTVPAAERDKLQYFKHLLGPNPAEQKRLDLAANVRERAYRDAYRGPTSKVATVMERLRWLDRRRCRKRFRG